MEIKDVEDLLGITITGSPQETKYKALLASAISHVNKQCGDRFTDDDGVVTLPDDVKMGVAMVVKSMTENQNVASQSLGDMSKAFFQGGTYKAATVFWKDYRKARIV